MTPPRSCLDSISWHESLGKLHGTEYPAPDLLHNIYIFQWLRDERSRALGDPEMTPPSQILFPVPDLVRDSS